MNEKHPLIQKTLDIMTKEYDKNNPNSFLSRAEKKLRAKRRTFRPLDSVLDSLKRNDEQ